MAKSQRKHTPQKPLKLAWTDFRLVDFRIVSTKCERLLPPDEAAKGTYKTSFNARIGIPGTDAEKKRGDLYLLVSVKLEGSKVTIEKEVRKVGPQSFTVDVSAEAWCTGTGKSVSEEDDLPDELVHGLVAQVYPLLMSRVRAYVADMGYRAVRPELGYNPKKLIASDAAPKEKAAA